jgi:hypothetical protein
MPTCQKCGKDVSQGAQYCPFCGARLEIDKDLLRERIAEMRHDEIVCMIISVVGFVIVGIAVLLGSITATRIEWVLFIPYEITYRPYVGEAILFVVLGIAMALIGLIGGIYYGDKRSKLMKELES